MNKNREVELSEISNTLKKLKARIDVCREEEQHYLNNIPESPQPNAERDWPEEVIALLDEAIDRVDDAVANIEAIITD